MAAVIWFLLAPRIYEANFSISLPKVSTGSQVDSSRLRLLISPQEFIRPTQDPMSYSSDFVRGCMGTDSNANRKKMINSLQLGVKQRGDVIAFTLRLEGAEAVEKCANLFLLRAIDQLTAIQDIYLKALPDGGLNLADVGKPALVQTIRLSDTYIAPDLKRFLMLAVIAGFVMTIFFSVLRNKYRA